MDTYRDSQISREIHFEGILLDSCPQISCLPSIHVILFARIPQFLGSLYTGEVCTSNQSEGVHKTKVSNHLFGEKKISQEGYPRLSASECLASLGLMLRFAETIVERHPQRGAITDQVLSLKLAVQHAYTVIKVKYGHASAQDLRNIWRIHLDAYKKAYPDSEPKPKHHYAGHLPDQYTLDGLLLDAFVLERKHHSSKAYGGHMTNPRTYGGAMLTHALLTQINELNEKPTALQDIPAELREPVVFSQELTSAVGVRTRVSKSAKLGTAIAHHGDFVQLCDGHFVRTHLFAEFEGIGTFAMVFPAVHTERQGSSCKLRLSEELCLMDGAGIAFCCVWAHSSDTDEFIVLGIL